jgi:phage I-like protein
MFFWTCKITIISIVCIFLFHHLLLFFQNTLTVPKIKDLVNTPSHRYESMYKVISSQKEEVLNPLEKGDSMKEELKQFLQSQFREEYS